MNEIKLTSFSHGAGCGCKISPEVLDQILHTETKIPFDPRLMVGNETKDDAAVFSMDEKNAIISTTDFFMPIVDDPFDFGYIASVNAISDIYAMGGTPIMALSILGWPLDKISPALAKMTVEGARTACHTAGISLAGGHSIDSPEPIFGLAVTGMADKKHIKRNNSAIPGCDIFLTKPLGTGILTTAQKNNLIQDDHLQVAVDSMKKLNIAGEFFGKLDYVKAMTDVTGFGLLGHLIEMCEGSHVSAEIYFDRVPRFEMLGPYVKKKISPGGTKRNFQSYGHKVSLMTEEQKIILCDPQTSGGLLVAVESHRRKDFDKMVKPLGFILTPVGKILEASDPLVRVI